MPLSRNLNCLVGGRGSGKSAAIEALSFVTESNYLDRRDNKLFLEDCRKRANATLSGCNIRLCWTVLDDQGEFFEKNTIFSSRYFDSAGHYGEIRYSDLNDAEIPAPELPVAVFRLHEIEELVDEPVKLLRFFDSLCGEDLAETESEIVSVVAQLGVQRQRIIEIAEALCSLTAVNSALRTYFYRKRQYDAVDSDEVRLRYERLDEAAHADRLCYVARPLSV